MLYLRQKRDRQRRGIVGITVATWCLCIMPSTCLYPQTASASVILVLLPYDVSLLPLSIRIQYTYFIFLLHVKPIYDIEMYILLIVSGRSTDREVTSSSSSVAVASLRTKSVLYLTFEANVSADGCVQPKVLTKSKIM